MANPYLLVSGSAAPGTSSLKLTVTGSMADTDSIYVGASSDVAGVTVTSVQDSQGNTYAVVDSDVTNATAQVFVWACYGATKLVSGTDWIKVTWSNTTSHLVFSAVGDPGVDIGGQDKEVKAHGTGTTVSVATGVLSHAEEHCVAFLVNANGGGTPTVAAPFTQLSSNQPSGSARLTAVFDSVTVPTSVTASETVTSVAWSAIVITSQINPVAITNTPPNAVEGASYSFTFTATGGTGGYVWTLTSGVLPTGLTLTSGGLLSGTPTSGGTFPVTITATDSLGGSSAIGSFALIITPQGTSLVAQTVLPGNLLTAADAYMETGSPTWVADTNASAPAYSADISVAGTQSLKWTATAAGTTKIRTGFYPVKALKTIISSYSLLTQRATDNTLSVLYYDSFGTFISENDSIDWQSIGGLWQPMSLAGYVPATATQFKLFVTSTAQAGDIYYLDLAYVGYSQAQVLIDWTNFVFNPAGGAGASFFDVTPFVRQDQAITVSYGRQDGISEINAGNATFTLQNDSGWFTSMLTSNIATSLAGSVDLMRRCQINFADEMGVWHTRFDGAIAELDYTGDNTGNTNSVLVTLADVLAFMNRQDSMNCWTKESVLSAAPILHWSLDDAGNAGPSGIAAETSGNNGEAMRTINTDASNTGTIAWQDTTGGVETLADASAPGKSNGSEFWQPGSNQPLSYLRGLDSGVTGGFTSPSPSIYLVPKVSTDVGGPNRFMGNIGYSLMGHFDPLTPTSTGSDYAVECWFTLDPSVKTAIATNVGPYIQLTLGNSKTQHNLSVGLWLNNTTTPLYTIKRYTAQPAYAAQNFTGANLATPAATATGIGVTADVTPVPHHLVLNFKGDSTTPTCTGYLDGLSLGSINLSTGQNFDTIMVGSGWDGIGCHAGGIQLVSIYHYQLPSTTIVAHASLGQYGMWEQTSDDVITLLSDFANIPAFWNNLSGEHTGLTMTEYQDITGSTALGSMQLFEKAEMGLLYVNSQGQLSFQTRDYRMGKGAPDVQLPPDTFDANVGMQLVDLFMSNEEAVASQINPTGSAWVSQDSQTTYGAYATNPVGSPNTIPLLSFSRVYGQIGVSTYLYWTDPYLDDAASWVAISRDTPWLVPSQLTIDLLTINPTTGLGISDFYALDIGSLIAPQGNTNVDLPKSWPDYAQSTEWFIEGVSETFSVTQRQIQYYCSAAKPQKAWRPGDSVYGSLGLSTRVGVSQSDLNKTAAFGKSPAHDGGPPYWPNDFTVSKWLSGIDSTFDGALGHWVNA